ncbi:hypothetical protein BH10PSE5_BH10PSE5_24690 [soil metagenome]
MRRADFLSLTALTEQAFNSLSSRGSLPFATERHEGRGWGRYAVRDALRMELALSLAQLGLTQISAATLVRTEFPDLVEVAQLPWGANDLWFGFAQIGSREVTENGVESAAMLYPMIGEATDIHAKAQAFALDRKCRVFGTVLINVSERIQLLMLRARSRPSADLLLGEIEAIWEEQADGA